MAAQGRSEPLSIYVVYSHSNRRWLEDESAESGIGFIPWLRESLAKEDVGVVSGQKELRAGEVWWDPIRRLIETADIALVLMTQDLLDSPLASSKELPTIVQRALEGHLRLIPIEVEPCDWARNPIWTDFKFANSVPLVDSVGDDAQWDEARFVILDAIMEAVDGIRSGSPRAVSLVVSYCESDAKWATGTERAALVQFLERRLGGSRVEVFVLSPEATTQHPIHQDALQSADGALLLVSQDYLNSQAYAQLRPWLLRRIERDALQIIPIMVRRALLERDPVLGKLDVLFADRPLIDREAGPDDWADAQSQVLSAVQALVDRAREPSVAPAAKSGRAAEVEPTSQHLIFISAKSEDYEYAARVHGFVVGKGLRVFFSRQSLPELGNADYGDQIDAALDEAAHMVVVTTSRTHVTSEWVKAEWRLFINEKRSGRKAGNLLTVIAGGMKIEQLPVTLRGFEVVPLTMEGLERLLAFVKALPKSPVKTVTPSPQPPEPATVALPQPVSEGRPWERPGTRVGEEIIGPDGGVYVWVPPGSFMMGSQNGAADQKPVHPVNLTGFWLGKYQVTNAQYRAFCKATGREFPAESEQDDDHPVVWIGWHDARAYCDHYGLRPPTEAQWEYAAAGPDAHRYPWGAGWAPEKLCWGGNTGPGGNTFPVGSFPAGTSWCGAHDMAGNVWEWCSDIYDAGYYAKTPATDPPGPCQSEGEAVKRVLRGGSWLYDYPYYFCCANRCHYHAGYRDHDDGFRCVMTVR